MEKEKIIFFFLVGKQI